MLRRFLCAFALLAAGSVSVAAPERAECIAGARPGGGFDATCKLAQAALQGGGWLASPLTISYMPGGIGSVVWQTVVAQRSAEPGTIIAFSGGSLLNIALGRFGKSSPGDVRWLATVGTDYGAVVVRADAPYATLPALVAALRARPEAFVFGGSGRVGSQDWMKSALLARHAGVNAKNMRFVTFEGGGEALAAIEGGHIQAYAGDVSELAPRIKSGKLRVLAVLAPQRLRGALADVPTAVEQGVPIVWTAVRGFYMGPGVAQEDYDWWRNTFDQLSLTPRFARLREESGMAPFTLTGDRLTEYVHQEVARMSALAREFGVDQ